MDTRIYVVKHLAGDKVNEYLVDASSRQTAERHVAKKFINAQVANGRTVAHLMAQGKTLEIAGEAPVEQENLPLAPADTPSSQARDEAALEEASEARNYEGGRRRRRA